MHLFCMVNWPVTSKFSLAVGIASRVNWPLQDRETETLELFPLKSCSSDEEEKVIPVRSELCGRAFLDAGRDLPLDLRLSFT